MRRATVTIDRLRRRGDGRKKRPIPADDSSCPTCGSHFSADEMRRNLHVCTSCGHHFRVSGKERIDQLAGFESWTELWPELRAADPLQFTDLEPYTKRVEKAEDKGLSEALVAGELSIGRQPCIAAAMDFGFLGGSMGSVVGEKLLRACDRAAERRVPLIVVSASGGARMQEGVLALMQMSKSVVGFEALHEAAVPVMSVLAHPTTGGVWASFAALGDVTYAEPGALISFSGPRVIEQTTREKLAPDFGLAETQLRNGQIDDVVDRRELNERLERVMRILSRESSPEPPLAMQWAQQGASRAQRAARALPRVSRRIMDRLRRDEEAE
ncbi:MAG: acetyl-CoA carboxylase carboxyl transferase subunit beta [Thermoleophilia bacterium]|nr:acetyl-CoA carboxylase carboxyl transferase subunit beta [Thermoleophilia bacterium]